MIGISRKKLVVYYAGHPFTSNRLILSPIRLFLILSCLHIHILNNLCQCDYRDNRVLSTRQLAGLVGY